MRTFIISILIFPFSLFAQEFNLQTFIETNHNKVADTVLSRLALDSLSKDLNKDFSSGVQWYDWSIYESDDSFFKIFHFSGEGCGAYCNPNYQSVVSISNPVNDSNKFSETDELYFEPDSIITLQKGKYYLIFGKHHGRPRGIEGAWGQTVILCSVNEGFKIKWQFKSTTSNLVDMDSPKSELSFNAKEITITYAYDWYDESEDFRVYCVSGIWKFNGATFEEQKKTTVYNTQ